MAKAKAATTEDDKKAGAAAEAATGPETPATGNGGEAEAEGAVAAAPSAEATPPLDVGPDGWVIEVKGPAKGRWRIGRHFGPEAVRIPAPELSDDQLMALMNDPELTVTPRGVA